LDVDLEQLWAEFVDFSEMPTSPPGLTPGHDHLVTMESPDAPVPVNHDDYTPSLVECIVCPTQDARRCFAWTGPDPLSFHTSADDIFLHLAGFGPFQRIQWVEFRLCRSITATGEVVEEHPFFLPRVGSILGNLARIRGQICDIISRQDSWGAVENSYFQLYIWPRKEAGTSLVRDDAFSCVRSASPVSLNPAFFVRNIT
jgi:hypothetical protein